MFKYSVYDKKLNLMELADVADRMKINCLETNNIFMQNGQFISWNQLEDIRCFLIQRQKLILCVNTGTPFYDIAYHKELFKRAVLIGVKYIQPLMDQSITTQTGKSDLFMELCTIAKAYNIGVLVENSETNEYSVMDFFENMFKNDLTVKPQFIFNPAGYVRNKAHPFFHRFYHSRLKNDIQILRINDCIFQTGECVLPGEGNAEIKEMASILLARSYDGWFSVGPYADGITTEQVIHYFKELLKYM